MMACYDDMRGGNRGHLATSEGAFIDQVDLSGVKGVRA